MRIVMLIVGGLWAYFTSMYFTVGLIMLGVWFWYEVIVYANETPARVNSASSVTIGMEVPRYHPSTALPLIGEFDLAGTPIESNDTDSN